MLDTFLATIVINTKWQVVLLGLSGISIFSGILALPKVMVSLLEHLISEQMRLAYQKVLKPDQNLVCLVSILAGIDVVFWLTPKTNLIQLLEFLISLSLGITITWLFSRAFKRFFDDYLLDASIKTGRKINSELLVLAKLLANALIVVITVIVFAQTHSLNIFGLFASLGVSGIAVAFAAQKTLEQLLGGIVIYIDRPFVVDDYIGLPDGTFGRVESIGLRSTKIRSSGKGTLFVVPNNALNQVTIENFTGAKKVISIIYLVFYRAIPEQEKALIRQVILECTQDIFGIDHRSTQVQFTDCTTQSSNLSNGNGKGIQNQQQAITQAQINFFILGSGETSLDLRCQLLDIAKQNITQQLKAYGIAFDIEDQTINVDSPITI
ncbi:MAG: mechanosensitive ion channel [Symploca sp. SIO1C4]|uniref:Mechanosensitive ion channel n=1 Tax=Symploca sp. SIO1C4 TaxID=2607765 RepID=A0A6B3MZ25_9CYAN|nr:mechanosensitive ion channel [Symploca sp. SIO1C4]